jgi:peptidoglycan/LPS O-acetylase OafA/YrhL
VNIYIGIINKILSWSAWIPLSRLTYSAYLVHTMIIIYYFATKNHLFHLEDLGMIYMFLSHVVFSYSIGLFISLFFEIPFIGLEKFIFSKD